MCLVEDPRSPYSGTSRDRLGRGTPEGFMFISHFKSAPLLFTKQVMRVHREEKKKKKPDVREDLVGHTSNQSTSPVCPA